MKEKIGILGSGMVGQALCKGFLDLGYNVKIGSRTPEKLNDFINSLNNEKVSSGDFRETSSYGDIIFFCFKGTEIESAINSAGVENFSNKIVVDVTNPLLFTEEGKAPLMSVSYPNSNGKKIQDLLPEAKVVKAFNTIPAHYMCNPKLEEGIPTLFICGDNEAKEKINEITNNFGWKDVVDLGNIEESYLLEALAMLYIKYAFNNNYWNHAFKLLKK